VGHLIFARVLAGKSAFEYNPVVTRLNSPATLKALVDSLRFDPFYIAISQNFGGDEVRRRALSPGLILVGGSDRVSELLKLRGPGEEKAEPKPITVTGNLVLEEGAPKTMAAASGR
jgi:hypothetical protein